MFFADGLMDLSRLLDNATVDHRHLDKLRLPTTPQAPTAMKGYYS